MSSVEYTSAQQAQIDALSAQIEAYCEANGIDPSVYTAALDGEAIDPAILNDPAFQAYWQRAYLELMEIINPSLVQSLYAETGEIDFDTLYATVSEIDPETNEFLQNLILDDPELMAYFASTDGDPTTDANAVLDAINSYLFIADTGFSFDTEYTGEDELYAYLYAYQDGFNEAMAATFEYSSELSANQAALAEALQSGEITPEEFTAYSNEIMLTQETVANLQQNLQDAFTNMIEMYSQLIKAQNQLGETLVAAQRPA